LSIASNGQITFAAGQAFPGTGTVSSVGSGQGLIGGPITTTGTLSLDLSFTDGRYAQLAHANTFTAGPQVIQASTGTLCIFRFCPPPLLTVNQQGTFTGLLVNASGGNVIIGQTNNADVFRVDTAGKGFFNGGTQTGGADFAESVAVVGDRSHYEPGDLLVIDREGKRRLAQASKPYSTLVAGIYSTKPGLLATPHQIDDPEIAHEVPLAVMGIVPCKTTAENGRIEVGDLLVTSSTPGYAMKGTDRSRMLGAVVGKALEPLPQGTGVIQVLVTLQ
jgi:hypothetical protein